MAVTKKPQRSLPSGKPASRPAVKRGLSFWLGFLTMATVLTSTLEFGFGFIPASVHYGVAIPSYFFLAMCLHDAIHKAAHQKRRWNEAFGWLCAMFFGLTFPAIRRAHLRHHSSYEHDHEHDVESFIYRSGCYLIPRLFVVNWKCHVELAYARLKERLLATTLLSGVVATTLCFPQRVIIGWLFPMQIALAIFALMTVYLPHGRYSEIVMRHIPSITGFHDDHHDRPQYPWYQYFSMHRNGIKHE